MWSVVLTTGLFYMYHNHNSGKYKKCYEAHHVDNSEVLGDIYSAVLWKHLAFI